jgi:hypothetical protein
LTLQLEHNTRKIFENSFPCDNRGLPFILLQAAKFTLNPAVRGFTYGPHKFQLCESDTEIRRNNEHPCELMQHIMKEINRKEQNYELNINKRNEYSNQLNQTKLALGNRLQHFVGKMQNYLFLKK